MTLSRNSIRLRLHRHRRARWIPAAVALVVAAFPLSATADVPVCQSTTVQDGYAAENALRLPYLPSDTTALLTESWITYRDRFIADDGRVIDWERADQHTTSEGQAYAMLRAVMINDRVAFHKTLSWAEANLARRNEAGDPLDQLWAWRWGEQSSGAWGILDQNFASDADIDAITALLFAANRWGCPAYQELAQQKLADLWEHSTLDIKTLNGTPSDGTPAPDSIAQDRILLPGPREAFFPENDTLILNPSYIAPYAFRLFADADPAHNWMGLVDSGYRILEAASALSSTGLPGDWIVYNPQRDRYEPLPSSSPLTSNYSFDAFRVWWRVGLDAAWFYEPRAFHYLQTHSAYLRQLWQEQQALPARLSGNGQVLADYEATAQYAMLYPALALTEPELAAQILDQKLTPTYENGFWDNDSAYYTQNLAWLGLLPLQRPSFSAAAVGFHPNN
ncbi:MAG: glycosyl hydrolase family 8 [Elainellaceae cyanobacterium]